MEKVTIATVADRAGVSRQTVSNVINSPDVVREETRERVQAAINELGYRVNQAARQMRTGRSRLIAVRIEPARDGINGSVLDRFLHGLTDAAAVKGYRVMLYTAEDDADEIATYENLLSAYELDAFVLTSTHHGDPRTSWLAQREVPFVTFGRPWGAPDTHAWVDVDNAAGTRAATEHLLAQGHRRIGFLGWPAGSGVGDARRAGWRAALNAAKTDGPDAAVIDGVESGAEATAGLMSEQAPPTALVCASDSLAVGALRAARETPLRAASERAAGERAASETPLRAASKSAAREKDIAVVGFDDTAVAQALGLTSVSQPLPEAAARCMDLLLELLDGRANETPARLLLAPSLVLRQTA